MIWDSELKNVKKLVNTGILIDLKYLNESKIVSINRDSFMFIHSREGELILELNLTQFGNLNSLFIHNSENIIIGSSSGNIILLDSVGNITAIVENGINLISALKLANGDLVSADSGKEIKIRRSFFYKKVSKTIRNNDFGAINNLFVYSILDIEYIFYSIGSNLIIIDSFIGKIINKITAISNIVSFTLLLNNTILATANSKSLNYYNISNGLLINESKFDSEILCVVSNSTSIYIGEGNGNIEVVDARFLVWNLKFYRIFNKKL